MSTFMQYNGLFVLFYILILLKGHGHKIHVIKSTISFLFLILIHNRYGVGNNVWKFQVALIKI